MDTSLFFINIRKGWLSIHQLTIYKHSIIHYFVDIGRKEVKRGKKVESLLTKVFF